MSDRFEFRVWDKNHKTYECCKRFGAYFIDQCGDLLFIEEDKEDGCWIQDSENFIVEQSTGLKDKNGKLIFEVDVVRYYRSTAMGLGGERIAQVLWDARDAEFGILTTLGDGYNMWEALRFGIEVIGNIHEIEVSK